MFISHEQRDNVYDWLIAYGKDVPTLAEITRMATDVDERRRLAKEYFTFCVKDPNSDACFSNDDEGRIAFFEAFDDALALLMTRHDDENKECA